ncbi:zinc ribbon domain-containing protein [Candidatus Dojkabacteria bacterium]|nr:zinc ribbon domain-containing protein [Candidatus Dojkabacteria bacterium]
MDKFEKQCQSCGMPLEEGKKSGSEIDGSLSKMFCVNCYQEGKFTQPDLTLDGMKLVLDNTIGKEGLRGKIIAFLGKMQLPSLKRWKV